MKEINSDFLERLLTNYDADIDLSEGGPAWTEIIQPIIDRLDSDPLEVDFQQFALALLRDRYPDLSFELGDALSSSVAKAMQFLMRPVLDQLAVTERLQSLDNWSLMSEDEMDARLTNFLHSREGGGLARGPVRIYFENPTMQNVSSGNRFTSKTGLGYFPTLPQSIASDTMLSNKEGNLYYFDVYVTAEAEGEEYNVAAEEIVSVTGMPQAVRVKNLRKFRGGVARETNEEALASAQQAVTEESLTSVPGIFTKIRRNISGIRRLRVVGYGDDEMTRDVIKGGSAGSVVSWAIDGRVVNDGDGDNKSQLFESPLSDFTQVIGPVGTLVETWLVSLLGEDHVVSEVVSTTRLLLADEIDLMAARPNIMTGSDLITYAGSPVLESSAGNFVTAGVTEGNAIQVLAPSVDVGYYKIIETNYGGDPKKVRVDQSMTTTAGAQSFVVPHGHPWYLRRKYLTLSDVPGGLIISEEADIPDDEIHIGGMTDVYVAGEVLDDTTTLLSVVDQNPIVQGTDLSRVSVEVVESVNVNFEENGVIPSHYLVIQEGTYAGTYRVLSVSGYQMQVDANFAVAFANIRFIVTDMVDTELTDPREVRLSGANLKVTLGTQVAVTVPLTNFSDYGVIAGDYLRIAAGPDEGDYEVTAVSGTGSTALVVNHTWTASYVNLSYEIYRKGDPVEVPLVSVDTVGLLDSNSEPTGIEVPYAKAMLSESRSPFENVGDGILVSYSSGVQLGIVSSLDLTTIVGAAIAGTKLQLNIENTNYEVVFAITDTTVEAVIVKIEAIVPDIAYVYNYGTEKRLALQSVDRLITVRYTGTANSVLGFDTTRNETNDQLVISDGTVDLEDYGVTVRSAVNVTSQDSPGYYKVTEVGGTTPHYYTRAYSVFGSRKFWLSSLTAEVDIGMVSHGIVRMYFKDPTYLQVQGPTAMYSNPDVLYYLYPWTDMSSVRRQEITKFEADVGGAAYNFYPDPDKTAMLIPADDVDQPNNGQVVIDAVDEDRFDSNITGAGVIDDRSTRVDFLDWWVVEGDVLKINTYALVGDIDLSAGGLGVTVDGKYLKIRKGGYLFTITFDSNDDGIDDIIDRINQDIGEAIAAKHDGNKYLVLEADEEITVESDGSADDLTDNLLRVVWFGVTTSNVPSVSGQYLIYELNTGGDHHHVRVRSYVDAADVYLDRMSAADIVNECRTTYTNHRTDDGANYHDPNNDTTNTLTPYTITYTSSVANIAAAWNDLVSAYNAHDANNGADYHTAPGSQHQYAAGGAAATIQDVLSEYAVFRPIWIAHLGDIAGAGAHNLADTTDLTSSNADNNVNIHFEIIRRGCQRLSPASMSLQQTDDGFYYADIEVVSEGAGNIWNVAEATVFDVSDYLSYGWYLSTANEALSYSPVEELWLHLTPAFLAQDASWDPDNLYPSAGQNYEVAYTKSQVVDEVHEYLRSTEVRNLLSNALGRHLLPAYVYISLSYTGGSATSTVQDDLESLVIAIQPDDSLSVYRISQLLSRRGAEKVENPIVLYAMAWESDRILRLYRSEDELDLGVRYATYVGTINLSRSA